MSAQSAQWTPERWGYDWGEGTRQARDESEFDAGPPAEEWTDALEIRRAFGMAAFDMDSYPWDIYPDTAFHEKPADRTDSAGGTDWLKIGERGSGKSNHSLHWACRLMEANDERVVWRGSPQRSEWLPFKEWTTLWLPANADVEAGWQFEGEVDGGTEAVDLEDVVREIVRYEDPVDLLEKLEARPGGTFNVVYPDPSFTGCEELTRETDRVNETLPFVPEWRTFGDESGTPLCHWWYAFLLAAIDHRPSYSWLSVIFDEAGDLTPEDAEDDEHKTYKKISLLRSIYADSRRRKLSMYWCAHYEENLHHKIRREVERRIDMADGTPNPRTKLRSSIPVGFGTVPMEKDIMSQRNIGHALIYNQNEFYLYSWDHISRIPDHCPLEAIGQRWLLISLDEPDTNRTEADSPTVQFDPAVFRRWSKGGEDRLYVKDPGSGSIDLLNGTEMDPLESPKEGMVFSGVIERDEQFVVELLEDDDPGGEGESIPVAAFPKRELGLGELEADLQEANP